MPKFPLIPTILVLASVATMIALGIWQLGRADEKEALIAQFESNAANETIVDFPANDRDALIYRTVRLDCQNPKRWNAVAGRNANGQSGYVHRYECAFTPIPISFHEFESFVTFADIGWSKAPTEPQFEGGALEGSLVPLGDDYKVVATAPLAALEPIARPDPNNLPNNHLAYAGQWFFFALTALVIYVLALKRRQADTRRKD